VRYLRKRLGDDRIERRALHGSFDMGDIFNIVAHGRKGIAECKSVKKWAKADLESWQAQTIAERGNADADFALLVVHKAGVGPARFGQNHCYLQVRDLAKIAGGDFICLAGDGALDLWVRVTVEDACKMIQGDYGTEGIGD
jgi:hypothetical protein